jgi:hypothetical protein
MPRFEPPPTYINEVDDPIWKKWFSALYQTVNDLETTATSGSVPAGGTTDQLLAKLSNTDFDTTWVDQVEGLPSGGAAGYVLTKVSGTDFSVTWAPVTGAATVDGGNPNLSDPQTDSYDGGIPASVFSGSETLFGGDA